MDHSSSRAAGVNYQWQSRGRPTAEVSRDYLLAIESTCDETAAAVIDQSLNIRASCVASQQLVHERFDGVVPELAARAHLERILPVIRQTIEQRPSHRPSN